MYKKYGKKRENIPLEKSFVTAESHPSFSLDIMQVRNSPVTERFSEHLKNHSVSKKLKKDVIQ